MNWFDYSSGTHGRFDGSIFGGSTIMQGIGTFVNTITEQPDYAHLVGILVVIAEIKYNWSLLQDNM